MKNKEIPKYIPLTNQTKEQWRKDNAYNWDQYEKANGKIKLIKDK